MSLVYKARSGADPATAWDLVARPDRWHEWAPHVRGAWGLGSPEVAAGRTGFVRLAPAVPIPVRVIAKSPAKSWTWRAGPVTIEHRVRAKQDGCEIEMRLSAAPALERVLAVSYGPIVGVLTRNLARVAAQAPPRRD